MRLKYVNYSRFKSERNCMNLYMTTYLHFDNEQDIHKLQAIWGYEYDLDLIIVCFLSYFKWVQIEI